MRRRRLFAGLVVLFGAGLFILLLWDPHPETTESFDRGRNGLWLGHKWYTGFGVRSGLAVTPEETARLAENLRRHQVRYAFVHVGPAGDDGRLPDSAGPILTELRKAAPQVQILAWLGARVDRIDLSNPLFQSNLLDSISTLRSEGFDGVHFDFEPMRDFEDGYIDLLERVRDRMGSDFIISQATPRAGPFGIAVGPMRRSFWSKEFYRETMNRSDQTVVMAYDTNLSFRKGYVAFVRHQTNLLADWACNVPGHEALIGIPAHEDVPTYADPEIENIHTAVLGVRSALESRSDGSECVSGVAVYANWVTDESEWNQYRLHWMNPDKTPSP